MRSSRSANNVTEMPKLRFLMSANKRALANKRLAFRSANKRADIGASPLIIRA
jgi:hypothetical protein